MPNKQAIEYYQRVIRHLTEKKLAFCFSESGQFLTVESCERSINWLKNEPNKPIDTDYIYSK